MNGLIQCCKIWPQKLQTFVCCMVQSIFQYLKLFRRDSWVWQTDRWTDILFANACWTMLCSQKNMAYHTSFGGCDWCV